MTVIDTSPRKPKDPERTRADILQAALEEFAELGFGGATIRGIAARTGMSHGMIRYHYESKEKLWLEAADFLFERLEREVAMSKQDQARLEQGDLSVFRNWLRGYVQYCARHPEHARIMMQESMSPSPRLAKIIDAHVAASHVEVFHVIDVLKDLGVFPKSAPHTSIVYMLSGACQNMFALAPEVKLSLDYDAQSQKAIDAHAETVVAVFCPET